MSKIKLIKFNVELNRWGDNKGKYTCKAEFKQGANDFTIELNEEISDMLVQVCKGEIAKASIKALEHLTLIARGEDDETNSTNQ
ncbi:hypothetical protein NVP1189B_41 [Vibrio phage 1.189.B._10N.286.51.B5]|nr:hypothetical protein NVP1189B_41 [Vibrio phage 1.189.B._10N.286.51.B5]AUR93933.1 hypothetical protein NVP1189C_41 [Vibrio phage 1.189.C._10N.286.51.B5]AUR93999.1 hypothetical protein NVP1189O_41 [Vibrio phage 1.189.O._10N.286.51.B5]